MPLKEPCHGGIQFVESSSRIAVMTSDQLRVAAPPLPVTCDQNLVTDPDEVVGQSLDHGRCFGCLDRCDVLRNEHRLLRLHKHGAVTLCKEAESTSRYIPDVHGSSNTPAS